MYKLTESAKKIFSQFEGPNGLSIFDTSKDGFVLGFGLSKKEGIERGLIEGINSHPLEALCRKNHFIHMDWVKYNLTDEQYEQFTYYIVGQPLTAYGISANQVRNFLKKIGQEKETSL